MKDEINKEVKRAYFLRGVDMGISLITRLLADFGEESLERTDKIMKDIAEGKTKVDRFATVREKEAFILGWSMYGIQFSKYVLKRLTKVKNDIDEKDVK